MKLIDKDTLAAEIEKMVNEYPCDNSEQNIGYHCALYDIQNFLDTLDVKEVDLEEEIGDVKHNYKVDDNRHTSICSADIEWIAEHFYELGLKAQGNKL